MLNPYIKGSNIIELVSEETNDDSTMYKGVLRVIGDTKAWSNLIVDVLRAPDSDSDYLTSIRKEYYISEDNQPTFCWVLVIWGDVFEAFAEIGPLLQKNVEAKPSPRTPPASAPKKAASNIKRTAYKTEDGTRTVTTVPLPFRRGSRNDPGTTKTLGARKGPGAFVSNVTSSGGL